MKISLAFLSISLVFYTCKKVNMSELPDPFEAGWNGEKVCEILEDNKKIRVLRCAFPPGIGHEKHRHAPHFGYTLKGGRFRINDSKSDRQLEVPTGYSFVNNIETSHEVLNIGDSTSIFLIIEYK